MTACLVQTGNLSDSDGFPPGASTSRARIWKKDGRWRLLVPVPGGFVTGACATWREAFESALAELAFHLGWITNDNPDPLPHSWEGVR
jgi:hypothetical protein